MKKNIDIRAKLFENEVTITELAKRMNQPRQIVNYIVNHYELSAEEKQRILEKIEGR